MALTLNKAIHYILVTGSSGVFLFTLAAAMGWVNQSALCVAIIRFRRQDSRCCGKLMPDMKKRGIELGLLRRQKNVKPNFCTQGQTDFKM